VASDGPFGGKKATAALVGRAAVWVVWFFEW